MSVGITQSAPDHAGELVKLRDGAEVFLHLMRSDDAAGLVRFHHTLSPETAYLRFFSVHPELSPAELKRFTGVDHRDREAVVATIEGAIVAVGRFDRVGATGDAEVAFVVADSCQGRGLGTVLFRHLAVRAQEVGIERFLADVLPHNGRMLTLFHHAGLPISSRVEDGVVHLVLDLAAVSVAPPSGAPGALEGVA